MAWIKSGARREELSALHDRATRAAAVLQAEGVGPGDSVALCLRNEIAFFEASLGAGMLGAYSIPLNWHSTAAEAGYILADSGAEVLLIHADLYPPLAGAVPDGVPVIIVETPAEVLADYGITEAVVPGDLPVWRHLVDAAMPLGREPLVPPTSIIYTSGTTGKPKGVKRPPASPEQAASLSDMLAISYGYTDYVAGRADPGDIVTAVVGPLYHTAPNVHALFSIRLGASVIIEPRFDPERLLRLIEAEHITHLNMAPIMFTRLLRLPEEVRGKYDLSSLRYVAHAAAPCPPPVKRAMIEWWGPIIAEYYGTTELGNVTHLTAEEWLAHPGSVGRPLPETDIRIIDDAGQPVAAGEIGEITARRKVAVDFTYQNDPAKRQAAEKGGLLAPGDMGYFDSDGYLYLCDRKVDMILSGGVNIYPAEIEAELHKLAGVADCAVFGIPDEEFGEAVMAVIQAVPGAALDTGAVRKALQQTLAKFKVPRRIEILDALPREDSGKIFKRKLRAMFWEGTGRSI